MARTPGRGGARRAPAWTGAVPPVVLASLLGCGALTACSPGAGAPPAAADPVVAVPGVVARPDQYQALLDGIDRDLGDTLARLAQARDPDEAEHATLAAASVSSSAGERLHRQRVDFAVQRAHDALTRGLGVFGRELAFLSQRVHEHDVCTGPTAAAEVRAAPSMPALRAIAGGFALPGDDGRTYRWGAALPPQDAPGPAVATLESGSLLVDRRAPGAGEGVLEVRNDGPDYAVVALSDGGSVLVSVAVGAGRSERVTGIPDGDHELSYTAGRDWDPGLGAFGRDCLFRRFAAPASFATTDVPGGTGYTLRTVTVRPGPADAETADVPARDLPR